MRSSSDILLRATERPTLGEAVEWIAGDLPLSRDADRRALVRALAELPAGYPHAQRAIRQLARVLSASDLDSARVIFDVAAIHRPEEFRTSLDHLADRCPTRGLDSLSSKQLIAAQRVDPFALEALCAIAGLSYKELTERVADLPSHSGMQFSPSQLRRAFEEINTIVAGEAETAVPGAVPARPIELMLSAGTGGAWAAVEQFRVGGVSYEMLLAQRAVGGSWLAQRNRTSGRLAPLLADRLCDELNRLDIAFERSTSVGGDVSPSALAERSACDKQVGVLALSEGGAPVFGVVFSTARDSGTARTNASRLIKMKRSPALPLAVVVAGPGWAKRHDTAQLAVVFNGRLYSERALEELAVEVQRAVRNQPRGTTPWQ